MLAAVGIALPDDRITDGKDILKVALDSEQPSLTGRCSGDLGDIRSCNKLAGNSNYSNKTVKPDF